MPLLNIIGNFIGGVFSGGIPTGVKVDTTMYSADSTLLKADNG